VGPDRGVAGDGCEQVAHRVLHRVGDAQIIEDASVIRVAGARDQREVLAKTSRGANDRLV